MRTKYVDTDKYYANEENYDRMAEMLGVEVKPADINGACVEEKIGNGMGKDEKMLHDVQSNIRERFSLEDKEDKQDY